MARFFRLSLLVAAACMLVASAATANIPDPTLSSVPGFITITPDGSFAYVVTVNGPLGPVNGANVEIRVSAFADPLVCWCVGQGHPSIFGTTDPNGQAAFNIEGGGCIDPARLGEIVSQVLADGIELAQPGINSPDVVNSNGDLNTDDAFVFDNNGTDPVCRVGLSDAVFHTGPIANGLTEVCSNFSDPFNDAVGLGDAVIVTPYIVNGVNCIAQ